MSVKVCRKAGYKSNKYAVTTAGIGDAAKRSASALHEAGNTMEEAVALIAGANASVQDTSKVGNA